MIDKEIIYIKKSPKIWYEFEDESLCVGSELDDSLSFRTTRSSNSKHSSRKSSANERHVIIKKYKPIRTKIFNKETGKNEVVFINDPQSKSYNEMKIVKKCLTSLRIAESSSYIFPTKKSASSCTYLFIFNIRLPYVFNNSLSLQLQAEC